ncbi:polysaccharide lyase family protein [Salix suchowensis]|nr:polysaccharide lyase family protein [Salix suchowensis]
MDHYAIEIRLYGAEGEEIALLGELRSPRLKNARFGFAHHYVIPRLSAESTAGTPSWNNSSSIIQLMYPAGSINPASQPQGGAEFYASPLEGMAKARQMVLTYSVFFPVDFNWVRGGKLPGLYGGRSHCSGGDDATDCFSTRMMWRQGGADRRPQQTRKPDGYFALDVDGKRVIGGATYTIGHAGATKTVKKPVIEKPEQGGGLLGPILGGILPKPATERRYLRIVPGNQAVMTSDDPMEVSTENADDEGPMLLAGQADSNEPVGFIGLFFR